MDTDNQSWHGLISPNSRYTGATIVDITGEDDGSPEGTVDTDYRQPYRSRSTTGGGMANQHGTPSSSRSYHQSSSTNHHAHHYSPLDEPFNPSFGRSDLGHSAYKCSRQTKVFPGRIRKRVVLKNGSVNLSKERVEKRSQRYLQDTFTTMVDIQWRWNLLVFSMGFLLSWLGFSCIWYIIAYAHGDFENDEGTVKCVDGINSFTSAFLFSIETQHTIGYGSRTPTTECPEAILIMCVQAICGVMIQCFVVGFVFAKLSRPKKRSQTLMFSRNAVICLRDGKMCLMFRVGDVRNRSHIIGCSISALVINRKVTSEGEVIPYYHNRLKVRFDNSDSNVFLVWPATIVHEVDESSPFYLLSAEEMVREKFEIVVILEGTIESTGQSIQARTSYLPCEILYGHRFEQMVAYRKDTGQYRVDYSKFNNTYEIDTPTCSAKDYYDYQRYINLAGHERPRDPSGSGLGVGIGRDRTGLSPIDVVSKVSSEDAKTSSGDSGLGACPTYSLLPYPLPFKPIRIGLTAT